MSKKNALIIQKVSISEVKTNPSNPRVIKDDKFRRLVQSIISFPQMLEIRPIVVNNDMIVLGGNMRLRACQEAGLKEVSIIKADDLTIEQQREFIIKDNVGFGEWDWEILANEWNADELNEWGIDLPKFESEEETKEHQEDSQLSWFLNIRCDNEQQTNELYEKFISEGYDVKIIN
jgi:ParB-like chromosome segregation protein Spo0J